jgi:hypothetical protein
VSPTSLVVIRSLCKICPTPRVLMIYEKWKWEKRKRSHDKSELLWVFGSIHSWNQFISYILLNQTEWRRLMGGNFWIGSLLLSWGSNRMFFVCS